MHISLLPEDVLGKILSELPTKQVASTSVLSKKWRNVFRLVYNLDFDDSVSVELVKIVKSSWSGKCIKAWYVFPDSFKNIVDRALQCDDSVKKFSLKCHVGEDNDSKKACVGSWISNVIERGVLELDLTIKGRGIHFLPPQLFASKTLVKLTLGTELNLGKLPTYVSLPSLKTLFVDTVFVENEDFCDVLLAGCPVLEELSIHHNRSSGKPLTISSPTVKRLTVAYMSGYKDYLSFNLPNLVYLDYSDFALTKYQQVNLISLVEAKLNLDLNWLPNLTNLFSGLRNVKILHLSPTSSEAIYQCVCLGLLLPVFNNLVKLSFGSKNMNKEGWKLLPRLLKQSPKLEILTIQDLDGYRGNVTMHPYHVKVLHVVGYRGSAKALKKLKTFLGKNECLELLQVEVAQHVMDDASILLQTKRDLMMLRGVSVLSECQIKVT